MLKNFRLERAAMLMRILIIVTCISMIGITVLPASAPCCCSQMPGKSSAAQKPVQCPLHTNQRSVSDAPLASCCHTPPCVSTGSASCCSQGTIKHVCGTCRCHEQMQVVALPANQPLYTIDGLAVLMVESYEGVGLPKRKADAVQSEDIRHPLTVVFLRTCSLLI